MCKRIFSAFVGRGLLQSFEAKEMLTYQHSGCSVDARVCIEAPKRAAHYLWAVLIARLCEVSH